MQPPSRPRAAITWSFVVALAAGLTALDAPAQDRRVEYAVKATFLYKFAGFVEWPPGAFAAAVDPLLICVAGNDRVTALIDDAVRDQSVDGHPIAVTHLRPGARPAQCHILYVAEAPRAAMAALLDSVAGAPVLTVVDGTNVAGSPVINFVLQDNRVRFDIDLRAAQRNRLAISSKLLALAAAVRQ
jgi:hypothetical protein